MYVPSGFYNYEKLAWGIGLTLIKAVLKKGVYKIRSTYTLYTTLNRQLCLSNLIIYTSLLQLTLVKLSFNRRTGAV